MGRVAKICRRTLRVFAITFLVVILLVTGIAAFLTQTGPGRAIVLDRSLALVHNQLLLGDLSVERLDGSFLRGLSLHDVILRDRDGEIVLRLDALHLRYALGPLISGRIQVDLVRIEGPHVHLAVDSEGHLTLLDLFVLSEEETAPPSLDLRVDRVELTGGSLLFSLAAEGPPEPLLRLDDIELSAAFRMHPDGAMRADVHHLTSAWRTLQAPLVSDTLALDNLGVDFSDERIALSLAHLETAGSRLEGLELALETGGDDPAPLRALMLRLGSLDVTPQTLEPFLDGIALVEPLRIEAELAGPAERIAGQVRIHSGDTDLPPIVLDLAADLRDPMDPDWRAHLALTDFDPARWVRLEDASLPEARISLGVHAEGRGIDPDTLEADVRVDIGPSHVAGYAMEGAWLAAGYREERVTLRRLQLWAAGLHLEADGEAGLDGSIELNTLLHAPDLATLRSLLADDFPPLAGSLRLQAAIRGELDVDQLMELAEDPIELGFTLVEALQIRMDARARALRVDSLRIGDLRLDVRSESDAAESLWAELAIRDLREGDLRVRRSDSTLRLQDRVVQLQSTGEGLPGDLRWRLDLRGGLEEGLAWLELRAFELDARGLAEGLVVTLDAPAYVEAELEDDFMPRRVRLRGLRLTAFGARVAASGSWRPTGAIEGEFQLSDLQLERLAKLMPGDAPEIAGLLTLRAAMRGTLRDPTFEATLELQEGRVEELRDLRLSVDAAYAAQNLSLQVESFTGASLLLSLDATAPVRLNLERGTADLREDRPLSLVFRTPGIRLADLVLIVPELEAFELAGTFSGEGEISGTLELPRADLLLALRDVGATAPIPGTEETWRVEDVDWDLRAAYGLDGGRGLDAASTLTWEGNEIVSAEAEFAADVRELYEDPSRIVEWVQGLTGRFALRMEEVDVQLVPEVILERVGLVSGQVTANVDWAGTLEGGVLDASLALTELGLEGFPVVDVRADVSVEETLRLGAGVRWEGGEVIRLDAAVDESLRSLIEQGVRPSLAIQGRLVLQELYLRDLAPWTDLVQEDESGVLQGYVDLFGTVASPELFGRVALRGLRLFDGSEGLLTTQIRYLDGELSVESLICDGSRDGLAADVRIGVPLDLVALLNGTMAPLEPMDWPVEGNVRVEAIALSKLLPEALASGLVQDVSGHVSASVVLEGLLGDPQIVGDVRLEQAAMIVVPLGRRFDEVNMQVGLTNEGVRLDELFIRSGRGEARASGEVVLEEWLPTTISIDTRFDRFLLADPTGAGVYLSGEVDVRGQSEAGLLGIDVLLRDTRVDVPDDIGADAVGPTSISANVLFIGEDVDPSQVGQRNPRRIGVEDESIFDDLRVDLRIRTEGTNEVRHTMATIRFEVDLGLLMEGPNLTTRGFVNLPSGEIRVAGRRIDIERGRIDFEGEGDDAFDPALDIRAVHVLSTSVAARLEPASGERATITIGVGGQASDPTITLQSDPGMGEEDIIFVLLTGRPRSEGDSDADAQSQMLATAGNLALGMLADRLPGEIPIDTIRIESDAQEGQTISRVEGGKYIRENLYLSVTYIPSATERENDVELALEWILRRIGPGSIRLEVRGGNAQKGGVEMLYNISRQ